RRLYDGAPAILDLRVGVAPDLDAFSALTGLEQANHDNSVIMEGTECVTAFTKVSAPLDADYLPRAASRSSVLEVAPSSSPGQPRPEAATNERPTPKQLERLSRLAEGSIARWDVLARLWSEHRRPPGLKEPPPLPVRAPSAAGGLVC